MPLRRFRRQYEQLSQFERERIIGMMEAGWSASQLLASAAIRVQVAADVPQRRLSNHTRRLAEVHLGITTPITCVAYGALPSMPPLDWCRALGDWTAAEWNQAVFSD
ncbi:hypothetical protein TNCV_2751891, partial [Trichonephila clavipes]